MQLRPLFLVLLCLFAAGLPGCREPDKLKGPAPGALALSPVPGNSKTIEEIASLQGKLRQPVPGKSVADTWANLGRAFVLLARQSNDAGYYAQADDAAAQALALSPNHPSALQVRQLVLLNGHRFVEARTLAEQQLKRNPRDEVAWGTLGDSYLELGNYEGALDAYQTMMDIKPDLRSYNRGAWMRWLIGDAEGAVQLMGMAIDAGSPQEKESLAYCRVQLGDLESYLGHYDLARGHYEQALRDQPRYAPALAARGRLLLNTGKTAEAIIDLDAALSIQPLTAVRATYIDALMAAGRDKDAGGEIVRLEREGRREDPRALSLFYSTHDREHQAAVDLAREELQRRPDIWSLDVMAWALYRVGKLDEAWITIQGATRLGTADPRLLYHRGRIAAARSVAADQKQGVALLRRVLSQSPNWDLHDAQEAREVLAKLDPGTATDNGAPLQKAGEQ